ncbi:MAG: DNA polymerase III subunit delta [Fimbriimonadaceae bacterium]
MKQPKLKPASKFSVEEAFSARLVLLGGKESELRLRALSEFLEHIHRVCDPFDVENIDADAADSSVWLSTVGTVPFLSERRCCVVRNLLRRGAPKNTAVTPEAIAELPESSLLILVADETSGDDSQQKTAAGWRDQWENLALGAGGYVYSPSPNLSEYASRLKLEAETVGKVLPERQAQMLIEMCGRNLSDALAELQKASIYLGERQQISTDDLQAIVRPSPEWSVFNMVDAAIEGNLSAALKQMGALLASQGRPDEAAFRQIVPILSRQLRLLWQARVIVEAKYSLHNVPDVISDSFPARNNLLKEPGWIQEKAVKAASKLSFTVLSEMMVTVAEADARLKGVLPSLNTKETLECMLMRISMLAQESRRPVRR